MRARDFNVFANIEGKKENRDFLSESENALNASLQRHALYQEDGSL